MPYRIIVAMSRNLGIGYQGNLPWNISADMQNFTKLTKGQGNNAIIMGRNTWESIDCKPLKDRDNIVMSRCSTNVINRDLTAGVANNINDVYSLCSKHAYDNIWIIGGSNIYRLFLENALCESCHITYIDNDYTVDTYFPMELCDYWTTKSITTLSPKTDSSPQVNLHVITRDYDNYVNKLYI